MKITKRFLELKGACSEGINWVMENCPDEEAVDVIRELENHRWDWANWLIVRVMTRNQYLAYAIFSAEQVIDIFEKKYPGDKRPRKAIEEAKKVMGQDTQENRKADASDAAYAACAASDAAYAADAASDAAYAACAASDAACAASDAAYAACAASDAACAADAVRNKLRKKILNYGLSLIKGEKAQEGKKGRIR